MNASEQPNLYSRRSFLKVSAVFGASAALVSLVGCGSQAPSSSSSAQGELDYSDWDAVLEAARGQEVSWYGYGGQSDRNEWIQNTLIPRLKENYDITLNLVGMDINDILTQLSGEMQAGVGDSDGTIDFVWINGENFASVKENGYVWGPFVDYLPNYRDYVDGTSTDITVDFGNPTEGYEAPYGKAQIVLWVDGAKISDTPRNPDEFLEFCKAHPGQVTYPEPGDFTGTAFISCLIAGVVGKDAFEQLSTMTSPTEDSVRVIIQPGLDYLKELKPYLWKQGTTYPADSKTVAQMYADGELVFNMGYADRRRSSTRASCPPPPRPSSSKAARWATPTSWPSPPTPRTRPPRSWRSTRLSAPKCSSTSTRSCATSPCSTWTSSPATCASSSRTCPWAAPRCRRPKSSRCA